MSLEGNDGQKNGGNTRRLLLGDDVHVIDQIPGMKEKRFDSFIDPFQIIQ